MFDVRVFHPNSPSYKNKDLVDLYTLHENQKNTTYGDRVMQIEKASFTPLVYSTHGGMGKQAMAFHKRISKLIAQKRKESYSDIINHMRTKLRFTLLKSVLISIRGVRGKSYTNREIPTSQLAFNP